MGFNRYKNNPEFINFLKDFEKAIANIPYNYCTLGYYPINVYAKDMLVTYIDIKNITNSDIDEIMNIVRTNTKNRELGSLIIAKIIVELRQLEEYGYKSIEQRAVNTHVFKIR